MGTQAKTATITLNPHNQDLESVHRIVGRILGQAGCGHCGLLSVLKVEFASNPPPELGKEGVTSLQTEGF